MDTAARRFSNGRRGTHSEILELITTFELQDSLSYEHMKLILKGFQKYKDEIDLKIKPSETLQILLNESVAMYFAQKIEQRASEAFLILKNSDDVIELDEEILRELLWACISRFQRLLDSEQTEFTEIRARPRIARILTDPSFEEWRNLKLQAARRR